ncbi:MAG: thiosulfate oxidation carrier protein SoxY [Leptothrix sp. (in: b-proteobacteria)]
MLHRRTLLAQSAHLAGLLATLGLMPAIAHAQGSGQATPYDLAAFKARNLSDLMQALGGAAPVASADVTLGAPDIAENGAVVPVSVASTLPGVKRLLLLVEHNPAMLSAAFDLSDAVEPDLATRIKMGQSSAVYGVAMMADGRVLYAVRDVQVTLGGCGD